MRGSVAWKCWIVVGIVAGALRVTISAADTNEGAKDERYPFRTDFANAHLPWYQPKVLEFPPPHSETRITGELVAVDFVHRTGRFRDVKTGELRDFTLAPYGTIHYLHAEADLRDVPLGTAFLFFLHQDEQGSFTRLAAMQDQFTTDASHAVTYRLEEAKLGEGRLLTTKHSLPKNQPDLGKTERRVTDATRVWKGDKQVAIADLQVGDELLVNVCDRTTTESGLCSDIWVGVETHRLATERQQAKFTEFTKARGVPGWVETTDGNTLTVALFSGDAARFQKSVATEFAKGKSVKVCVANDELRTWNPPVDGEGASILESQQSSPSGYGDGGTRIVVRVSNMLEGFRRGRVVRIFGPGWKVQDQFYGESLMGYGFGRMLHEELRENPAKEYPDQFPFRTEFGNYSLPWHQLRTGATPPPFSEHVVYGALTEVGSSGTAGKFVMDRTGEIGEFTLIEKSGVQALGKPAKLSDLPLGMRCRFHLYQDEQGKFTQASFISDEYSRLASNFETYRVTKFLRKEGKLHVARQIPEVKDYNGDMQRPPDIGACELRVAGETRVWRHAQAASLDDLREGEVLRVNVSGELPGKPSICTDIWLGGEIQEPPQSAAAK